MACVILIDPQSLTRELLAMALVTAGYEVRSFGDEPKPEQAVWADADALIVSAGAIRRCDRGMYQRYRQAKSHASRSATVVALVESPTPQMQTAFAQAGIDRLINTGAFDWQALVQALPQSTQSQPLETTRSVADETTGSPAQPAALPKSSSESLGSSSVSTATTSHPTSRSPMPVYVPDLDEQNVLKTLSPAVTREMMDGLADRLAALCPNDVMTQRVKALLASQAEVDPLTQAIGRDPVLTLRVLAWANALPNPENHAPAESLRTAVDRLGRSALSRHLEAIETQPADDVGGIDWLGFTLHAKAVAHLAAEIARLRQRQAEEIQAAFTSGMIHDLGRLLYARLLPTENSEVLEAVEALSLPVERVEQQMLLDDHAQIMDKALRRLNMGSRVINAVACHHLPLPVARNLSGRNLTEVLQLALADRLANAMLYGEPDTGSLQGAEHHIHVLRLPTDQLRRGMQQVGELLLAKRESMIKDLGLPGCPQLAYERFHSLPVQPRPIFIGSDPHNDPVAIFCRSLCPEGESAPPNIAVVRMTNVREREALTGWLKATEFEKGTGKLPVLMLSPRGNLTLDDSALPGRRVELHAEPFPYPRLLTTLQRLQDENRQKTAA